MDEAELHAIIEQGMTQRGWIANSHAQIEFLLGDLIVRCRDFPEYQVQTKTVSHSAATRVKKVRAMAGIDGHLSPFADGLLATLDAFESNYGMRNLLAHGLCEVHHTPSGDAGFVFKKFDREAADELGDDSACIKQTFRLVDLQYHRAQMEDHAEKALHLFQEIHNSLGWHG